MTIHINNCESKIKKNMQAYCVGKAIILPHVRYIDKGNRQGMLFHSQVISPGGNCHTLGCDRMDVSGLCRGHKMSRREFLERCCGGVEPEGQTIE